MSESAVGAKTLRRGGAARSDEVSRQSKGRLGENNADELGRIIMRPVAANSMLTQIQIVALPGDETLSSAHGGHGT